MPHPSYPYLDAHLEKQRALKAELDARFEAIETTAELNNERLKQFLKETLRTKFIELKNGEKIAVTLVDIQNDFVLDGFALYAPGGENTVTRNIALLEAITDLITEHPQVAQHIEIVTSQDAHILGRDVDSPDSRIMARSSYGHTGTQNTIVAEQHELEPIHPQNGQYGLHCLTGTVGSAIAEPIKKRLQTLRDMNVQIYHFGKINFSGLKAGMLLADGVDISDEKYQNQANGIYDPKAISYLDLFKRQRYKDVLLTGICANGCVQQTAEGLVDHVEHVSVIDPLVHYFVVSGLDFDTERRNTVGSYDQKGIEYVESIKFYANPEIGTYVKFVSLFNLFNDEDAITKLRALNILTEFDVLIQKTKELIKYNQKGFRGYTDASSAAIKLCYDLNQAAVMCPQNTNDLAARIAFKEACSRAITEAQPTLEHHRGWSEILHALASAIVSICSLGIANCIYDKSFLGFFKVNTDSASKLDRFNDALNLVCPPIPDEDTRGIAQAM